MNGSHGTAARKTTTLFDLGGTLARYYDRAEFPPILIEAIGRVWEDLKAEHGHFISADEVEQRVQSENFEASDYRVRPLEKRLANIFGHQACDGHSMRLCRLFLEPIVALGRLYDEALPVLHAVRRMGLKIGIVSNTPWGSPAALWQEELQRLGLHEVIDGAVFCTDVGWRKPHPDIFEYVLRRFNAVPEECLFVGDDPRWDLVGPQALGMDAIIIDRNDRHLGIKARIRNLTELIPLVSGSVTVV